MKLTITHGISASEIEIMKQKLNANEESPLYSNVYSTGKGTVVTLNLNSG